VLAGGLARRMGGGDKARLKIGGISILDRVLATLSGQCVDIIINANGDRKRFEDTGCVVVPDNVEGHPGPLAGILAGLDWLAEQNNGVEWILSVPGDCPFLPDDLVEKLHVARRRKGAGVPLACARSGEWRHPVVGLWPLALRQNLRKALVQDDMRKIEMWTGQHGVAIADWPDQPVDPFFNVNTPEDVARAEQAAAQTAGG
jgi:molybdopterin-guanine dinucleotide biosynthesis protein A